MVWKLDRLGRSLPHLVETVRDLGACGVGFKSVQESIDTTTSGGYSSSTSLHPWLSSNVISFASAPTQGWPPRAREERWTTQRRQPEEAESRIGIEEGFRAQHSRDL